MARPPSTAAPTQANGQRLLQLESVSFHYGSKAVLRQLSLAVDSGESICILGENGAGKSTLLKLCAGLLKAQSGRIAIDGTELGGQSRTSIARSVAYLPQECTHVFPFTALEVVLMGRYARSRTPFESADDLRAAEAAMQATDVTALRDRAFNQLSGGERRRVLLSQALAQDTPLILLDEPTAGLDPAHALSLGRAMDGICARGKALLFATHDLNLASRFAHRALLIHEGQLRLSGPTLQVLEQAGPLLGVQLHIGTLPSGVPYVIPT